MSEKINITIDDKKIKADPGQKVLWAALENDIYIPNLCAIADEPHPSGACRLCFVEINGRPEPVTACTQIVKEGMVVKTRTHLVDRLVKTAFLLLLSDHELNCKNCAAKKYCELIKIAKKRGIKLKKERFRPLNRNLPVDTSPKTFILDRNKCVLCGKCRWTDRKKTKTGILGFTRRGLNRMLSTYLDKELGDTHCTECGQCVEVCPVGALTFKEKTGEDN